MPSEVTRLKQREGENRRLKQTVADLSLDKEILQDVLQKRGLKPDARRELAHRVIERWRTSERYACQALGFHRSTHRYESVRGSHQALRLRIKELAMYRPRFGYRRIWVLLRREG